MRKETRTKINQCKEDLKRQRKFLLKATTHGYTRFKPSLFIKQHKVLYSSNIVMKAVNELVEECYMAKYKSSSKRYTYDFIE